MEEQGLLGFSMRGVAERVGVTATALYRHFADKDALLASLLEDGFRTFSSYLMRSLAGRTPLERFRRCGQQYFDFALEHLRDYALMFMTPTADRSGQHFPAWAAFYKRAGTKAISEGAALLAR
jgi:AcrR family transcriptional regulator